MFRYVVKEKPLEEKVAGLFPKGKISLLYGDSGLGKTVSTVKALNAVGVVPILYDFDDNPVSDEVNCEYILINGENTLVRDGDTTDFRDDNFEVPRERVFIIDTWSSFSEWFSSERDAISFIKRNFIRNNNTVIIIGHAKDIATRRDIPMMDEVIANHLASKLWLREPRAKEKAEKRVLEVKKLRGSNINRIAGWMEPSNDDEILEKTKEMKILQK